MSGIIGSMLAGAAESGGKALAGVGNEMMRGSILSELKAQEAAIQEARDARLHENTMKVEDVRQSGENKRLGVREAGENTRTEKRETGATARQVAGFTHSENLATARQAFDTEQNSLQRELTREQIQANKDIAASNRSLSLEIAKLGGTVQQDKNGNVLYLTKDGTAKQIMDPNNPDKPLQGFKDLTPAAKAYADVIKDQLKGLNATEAAGGDVTAIQARRAELNTQLLNVLTGGVGEAGQKASPQSGDRPPLAAFDKNAKPAVKPAASSGIIESGTAGPSDAEFNSMLADAKRGGATGKDALRRYIDSGTLPSGKRIRAQQALGD